MRIGGAGPSFAPCFIAVYG